MSTRDEVLAAGELLRDPLPHQRQAAAAELLRLARARASLVPVKAALRAALDDADGAVQVQAALALLVDGWRFAGLLPVVDALEPLAAGSPPVPVRTALVTAAALREDVREAAAPLIPLLALGLPRTAQALLLLAGQGADVGAALEAIEARDPQAQTPLGQLWMAALERAPAEAVLLRAGRLRLWMRAPQGDWRYDDVRYRAAGLLARAAIARNDDRGVLALAADELAPIREAAAGALAAALGSGRHQRIAMETLLKAAEDPAGGVRYAAVKGLARAAAAGVDLRPWRREIATLAGRASYIATGWTHPLDAAASSDLRGESAAADLAQAAVILAERASDAELVAELRAHADPEIARALAQIPS